MQGFWHGSRIPFIIMFDGNFPLVTRMGTMGDTSNMNGHISKPISIDVLNSAIKAVSAPATA